MEIDTASHKPSARELARARYHRNLEKSRKLARFKYARRMARNHPEFLAKRREIQARYRARRRGVHIELIF